MMHYASHFGLSPCGACGSGWGGMSAILYCVVLCTQWLTILPEDDEKTKAKKKKLIKSYKSKMRFAKLDQETKVQLWWDVTGNG